MENKMSKSARSILIFGIYLFLLGLTLMVSPNILLVLFGVAPASEVWIRVAGMLTLLIGGYYILTARAGLREFFRYTVYLRSTVIVFFTIFVLFRLAEPALIFFGLVDLLGALWTWLSLRSEPA